MGKMKHRRGVAFKFNQVLHIIFINIFIAHFTLGLQQTAATTAADKEKHGKRITYYKGKRDGVEIYWFIELSYIHFIYCLKGIIKNGVKEIFVQYCFDEFVKVIT